VSIRSWLLLQLARTGQTAFPGPVTLETLGGNYVRIELSWGIAELASAFLYSDLNPGRPAAEKLYSGSLEGRAFHWR